MTEEIKSIVSMVRFNEETLVATLDSIYRLTPNGPVLVAGQDDFRKADEEFERSRQKFNQEPEDASSAPIPEPPSDPSPHE